MKWNEMSPADRDALVATKIMGWTPKPCDLEETDGELTVYSSGDACCPRCGACEHINSFEHGMLSPPRYTKSMDAAWQVVEKMVDRMDKPEEEFEWLGPVRHKGNYGRGLFESHSFDYTKKGGFASLPCWYVRYAQNMRYTWILSDTPQEAICLASLRAAGVEIEK